MSFLFHRKTKKVIQWAWAVIALLVIISMVAFFAPGIDQVILMLTGKA